MTLLHVVVLSLVEGITEFLPISSTAHLLLTAKLLNIPPTPFLSTFEIVIQLGAILAVVASYTRLVFSSRTLFLQLCVGFIPTAVIGFTLYPLFKSFLQGSLTLPLFALLVGGVFLVFFEKFAAPRYTNPKPLTALTYTDAFIIGCAQTIAIIPGVSRSAATVVAGLARGFSRSAVVEFSFLLALPTMAAATTLDLYKQSFQFLPQEWLYLGVGCLISAITAYLAINWLLTYVKTHDFTHFGFYRIFIAIIGLTLIFA